MNPYNIIQMKIPNNLFPIPNNQATIVSTTIVKMWKNPHNPNSSRIRKIIQIMRIAHFPFSNSSKRIWLRKRSNMRWMSEKNKIITLWILNLEDCRRRWKKGRTKNLSKIIIDWVRLYLCNSKWVILRRIMQIIFWN